MPTQELRIPLFQKYDVVATTDAVFGKFGPDRGGRKPAKTSGSSTTVTKVTAGDTPFEGLQVGGELSVNRDGTWDVVYVTTFTDNENIVVDTAVNWADGPRGETGVGRHFHWRPFLSGQADTDGWVNVRQFESAYIAYSVPTFNATSLTLSFEGRVKGPQMAPITILTISVTGITPALNGEGIVTIPEGVDEVRMGALVNTDTGVNTLNAYLIGKPRTDK